LEALPSWPTPLIADESPLPLPPPVLPLLLLLLLLPPPEEKEELALLVPLGEEPSLDEEPPP
jgi:hypothetical protein